MMLRWQFGDSQTQKVAEVDAQDSCKRMTVDVGKRLVSALVKVTHAQKTSDLLIRLIPPLNQM
jgi:hypothetical protein